MHVHASAAFYTCGSFSIVRTHGTDLYYVLRVTYILQTGNIIMSQEEKDLDVNKAFEDLLFAEEITKKSAYEKGYKNGKKQLLKGYHLGYHRASIIAASLGYYSGVLEQYLQNNIDTDTNKKTVAIAQQLLQDIRSTFPSHQDDNLDILKIVEDIKFKYAKFCSLAKITPLYPETNKLDF